MAPSVLMPGQPLSLGVLQLLSAFSLDPISTSASTSFLEQDSLSSTPNLNLNLSTPQTCQPKLRYMPPDTIHQKHKTNKPQNRPLLSNAKPQATSHQTSPTPSKETQLNPRQTMHRNTPPSKRYPVCTNKPTSTPSPKSDVSCSTTPSCLPRTRIQI